jgi:hypothetical protein
MERASDRVVSLSRESGSAEELMLKEGFGAGDDRGQKARLRNQADCARTGGGSQDGAGWLRVGGRQPRAGPGCGHCTSDDTVLRRIREQPSGAAAATPIGHLEVNDCAWRKGQSYGTILVNLDLYHLDYVS